MQHKLILFQAVLFEHQDLNVVIKVAEAMKLDRFIVAYYEGAVLKHYALFTQTVNPTK